MLRKKHWARKMQKISLSPSTAHDHKDAPPSVQVVKEVDFGGDYYPGVVIHPHAINMASVRALDIFLNGKKEGEGLYTFLQRMVIEAQDNGEDKGTYLFYKGMKLPIKYEDGKRVLITVMVA